jgi:hypothetical protein
MAAAGSANGTAAQKQRTAKKILDRGPVRPDSEAAVDCNTARFMATELVRGDAGSGSKDIPRVGRVRAGLKR